MKAAVTLTVTLSDSESRKALSAVLAPDNEGLPRGLTLTADEVGREISFKIESDAPSVAVSTALALLRDISVFREVWLLSHGNDARVRKSN